MNRGCWRNILKIFIFYLALIYTSAAIFMVIESYGIQEKLNRSSQSASRLKDFIQKRFKVIVNQSEIDEFIGFVKNEITDLESSKNSEWKKTIDLKAFKAWLYFVRVSAATVGKCFYVFYWYQALNNREGTGGSAGGTAWDMSFFTLFHMGMLLSIKSTMNVDQIF